MFLDLVKIKIKSGDGGNGTVAWRREKFVAKGGPAGGDGGKGANIILKADKNINTLLEFRYKSIFVADNGEKGRTKNCHGKNANDLIIRVPVGTLIKETDSDRIIGDMVEDGQELLVAAGGRGGRGNARFATATRQAPQFCEPGEPGVERELELELKLIADVGIIGLPNAGKSTLISVASAAKPKIADYPFTTLVPNLGVVKKPDGDGVVFADIPGLIEGASDGIGLGHQFLRHVERTRILIHMVDVLEEDPIKNFKVINSELEKYSDRLAKLEQIVAINKIDAADPEIVEIIKNELKPFNENIFEISAATKQGVKELINYTLDRLSLIPKSDSIFIIEDDTAAFNNDDSTFMVYKDGPYFVEGGRVSRLVSVTDLTNSEALFRLQNILRSMGVFKALKDEGIQNGDLVIIDKLEFEYYDDYEDINFDEPIEGFEDYEEDFEQVEEITIE